MTTENIIANITAFVKDFPITRTDVETAPIRWGHPSAPNMSTAYTWMIQAAGHCKFYASDLLYDIRDIDKAIAEAQENAMNGLEVPERVFYIAVREMGVDHNAYIASKIDPDGSWRYDRQTFAASYTALFRVTVAEADCYGEKAIRITTEEFDLSINQNRESA